MITRPISVEKVKSELKVSSNKVEELCVHPAINKWSRHKPYAYPTLGSLYGASGTDDTLIKNMNYFLGAKVLNPNLVPREYMKNYQLWDGWSPPAGGANEPRRLQDFEGYNHEALPPYGELTLQNMNGGGKIIVSDSYHPVCRYIAKLDLIKGDIPLDEINMGPYGSLANSYLTLVIGYRIVGSTSAFESGSYIMAHSMSTVQESLNNNGQMYVELDTHNMKKDGINLNYDGMIILAYLTGDNTSTLVPGVSLQIDDTLRPILYFESTGSSTSLFAEYINDAVVGDVPKIGENVSGSLSYPQGIPYIEGNNLIFGNYIRINANYSLSGRYLLDIHDRGDNYQRTVVLKDFMTAKDTNSDTFIDNIIPLQGIETNGVYLYVRPEFENGILWSGNVLESSYGV